VAISGCGDEPRKAAGTATEAPAALEPAAEDAALASLPYATWVPTPVGSTGVLRFDPRLASPGLTLYAPRNRTRAHLIDLAGELVHTWSRPGGGDNWHHVEPASNGRLLCIVKDLRLEYYGWDSGPIWVYPERVHHDVAMILVPARVARTVSYGESGERRATVLDEHVVRLSPDGRELSRISIWDLLGRYVPVRRLEAAKAWLESDRPEAVAARGGEQPIPSETPPDIFHLNSIEILERDVEGIAFAGDLLVSIRNLDRIAIIDPEGRSVRWIWGAGELDAQHQPSLLPDGKVLVFDNGVARGSSRVLEVDPLTDLVGWVYPTDRGEPFFSRTRGAAQRLANGDTLITDSNSGRLFEVTRSGETVWEYLTTDVRPSSDGTGFERVAIYRGRRLAPSELRALGWAPLLRATTRGVD
jgi:hypothetical protein